MKNNVRLRDIAEVVSERVDNPSESSLTRFVGLEHYDSGELVINRWAPSNKMTSAMKAFRSGDVLIARRNVYLKRASMVEFDGITSGDSIVLRKNNSPYGMLLPFLVNTSSFWNYANTYADGTMSKRLSVDKLLEYSTEVPEEGEIETICSLLWAFHRLSTAYQKLLIEMDNIVKSRFVEMFGDININDKGWEVQPLGELCTIVRGGSPRPIEQFLGGDIPWIKIGDATEGESIYLNSTKEHIIQEGVKKSRLVKKGSLIFANCGVSLGFARIITFDGCIHDGWLAMEDIDSSLNKIFLLQTLNQMTDHFRKIAPAGTQPNLNTAIMKSYKQIIPPMKLQNDFIDFVSQIDKSKFAIQQALDSLLRSRNSIMEEVFG